MKRVRGFTLIELIIVLSIGGILVAVGVPNLAVFLKNSARTTRLNDLVTALNYARSEAVKRNTDIRVCASSDAATCLTTSTAAASTSFSSGWIVSQVAPASLLRVFEQDLSASTSITGTIGAFIYAGSGFPGGSFPGAATFTHCDDRGVSAARAVLISNSGHPGISRPGADDIHESGGVDLTCP